jgi:hypothetical protein
MENTKRDRLDTRFQNATDEGSRNVVNCLDMEGKPILYRIRRQHIVVHKTII